MALPFPNHLPARAATLAAAALLALGLPQPASAGGPCITAQDSARANSSSQRVTLSTVLKLSDKCEYGLSPQGPWHARPAGDGDFASIALSLSTRAAAQAGPAVGDAPAAPSSDPAPGSTANSRGVDGSDSRVSSLFALPRPTKRARAKRGQAAGRGLQSVFLAGCTQYLIGGEGGFAMSVPVDTGRPTVARAARGRGACGSDGLSLRFLREAGSGVGDGGAPVPLRAGPWDASLEVERNEVSLEPGRWAIYAGRGDAGLLVGRLSSGRADSGLRSELARIASGADSSPWFRPTWERGYMQLQAASGAVAGGALWAELRTAAAAGAVWFAQPSSDPAQASAFVDHVRIGADGEMVALPDGPLQARMRARYGRHGEQLVPTWEDWRGTHDGLSLCVARRYGEGGGAVAAGGALPAGAVCAPLAQLTAPLQARGGAPIAPARICLRRHHHRLTVDGDAVGDPIGEQCIELPTEPAQPAQPIAAPTAPTHEFPLVAVGDELLYSGTDSGRLQLCVDNACEPMAAAGQWRVLDRPGLVEVRHAPVPSRVGSKRGLSLLRLGVIDPARQWHPVGLVRMEPSKDDDGVAPALAPDATPWGTLDHHRGDTFAYVRRQQRMDFRLSLSPTLVAAYDGAGLATTLTRNLPIAARVQGDFGAPEGSALVAVVTREDNCPDSPAGALQPDDLLDPERALVGETFHVHLARYRGGQAPYRCIASARMRVTPRLSKRASDDLRVGLLGDLQAVMFVMPRAAVGVALPVGYARYAMAHGFELDASASLTVAASIDGPDISRAGVGLSGALMWGPPGEAPALLSIGVMLHGAAATHSNPPVASLFAALNLSTLLDLAGGR